MSPHGVIANQQSGILHEMGALVHRGLTNEMVTPFDKRLSGRADLVDFVASRIQRGLDQGDNL
jgi:hypothetical protein